jgi:hypothetical protein
MLNNIGPIRKSAHQFDSQRWIAVPALDVQVQMNGQIRQVPHPLRMMGIEAGFPRAIPDARLGRRDRAQERR